MKAMASQARISASVLIVLTLAVLATVLALSSTRRSNNLAKHLLSDELPAYRVTRDLESSLLAQRGIAAYVALGEGSGNWPAMLKKATADFERRLEDTRSLPALRDRPDLRERLTRSYARYDSSRDSVIALCDAGDFTRARALLLARVPALAESARTVCHEIEASIGVSVRSAVLLAQVQAHRTTIFVACLLLLLIALALTLLWFLHSRIMRPLQLLAADARAFGLTGAASGDTDAIGDEVREVGFYLRTLMTEVKEGRATAQKNQKQLISVEKFATIGRLAACIAHELRSPLTCMKTWLYTLQRSLPADPANINRVEMLGREVKRLDRLVENLVDFTRPRAMTLESTDVEDLIDETLLLVQQQIREKQLRVAREKGNPLPRVRADAEMLKQVLINLLTNAVECMPEGGEIRVTTSVEPCLSGRHGPIPGVIVRIADDGPGIAEEVRTKLFQPFITTKEKGMGLGLSIAAEIMDLHSGKLVLESSGPRGSRFAVYVPAVGGYPHPSGVEEVSNRVG